MANGFAVFLLELAFLAMVSSHLGPLAGRHRRAADPDDIPAALTKSPCGDDKTLCESADQYPAEYIDKILKNSANQFKDLLGVDELNVEVRMRASFETEFEMCRSTERVVFPKIAKSSEGDWLFVANVPDYRQGVRAEICQEEKESCQLSEAFPTDFNSSCVQKYIYRKMLVLLQNGTSGTAAMKLPSSCACLVTRPLRKDLFDSAISGKEMSQPTPNKTPTAQETETPASGLKAGVATVTPTGNCEDNTTCHPSKQLPSDSQGILEDGTTKEEKTLDNVNRWKENDTEFELCSSNEVLVFPKSDNNKEDDWLFAVNQPNYLQGVRVELCQGENLPCALSEYLPNGLKSSCKQKYIYHRTLTFSKNGTQSFQSLKIPSSCSCIVTSPLGM